MANAMVFSFDNYALIGSNFAVDVRVVYVGTDVPGGGPMQETIRISFDPSSNVSQINAAIGSAVRAFAVSKGFTVPSNEIIASALSKA